MVDSNAFHRMDGHLSEDEIDAAVTGEASVASRTHLVQCGLCRDRVRAFQSAVSLFNQASLSWTEAKPVRPVASTARSTPTARRLALACSCAMAVLIVFLAAIAAGGNRNGLLHRLAQSPQSSMVRSVGGNIDPSATEVAQDNALLQAIASEMRPVSSPVLPYESRVGHRPAHAHIGSVPVSE